MSHCTWRGLSLVLCELDEEQEPANYEDTDCALHGVSPRDRWLCVLPRWRMNVNVNTECCVGSVIDVDDFDSYVRCTSCDSLFSIECFNSLHRAVVGLFDGRRVAEGDVFDDDLGVWATLRDAPWRARPTDQAREASFKRVEAFRRLARARALREHVWDRQVVP